MNDVNLNVLMSNTIKNNNIKKTQIDKVSQEFESVFLAQAFDQMFSSVELGYMSGGYAEKTWKSMMAQEYAKEIAKNGETGISESIKSMLLKYEQSN
jgi:Rod binding domain-containing protein